MSVLGWNPFAELDRDDPEALVEAVLSATGEVSSLVYAATLLDGIEAMADDALLPLLAHITTRHDLDTDALSAAAAGYAQTRDAGGLATIASLAEPRWVELFRRLNATEDAPSGWCGCASNCFGLAAGCSGKRLDEGLKSLLRMWFNPGLILQPIDWSTPANILEKIIAYEAVHAISSWDDLRTRLAPDIAAVLPSSPMPEEPLIFVEVALTEEIPAGRSTWCCRSTARRWRHMTPAPLSSIRSRTARPGWPVFPSAIS